jgi:hypothetical protein
MVGFKNVVKRWLKIESSKLKAKFMGGKINCLMYIEPPHWEKLKAYQCKPELERKAEQMFNARSKMTNMANVGRQGKAKKEAKLVLVDISYFPSSNFYLFPNTIMSSN